MQFPNERQLTIIGASTIGGLLVVFGQSDKAVYIAIAMLSYLYGEHNGIRKAKVLPE